LTPLKPVGCGAEWLDATEAFTRHDIIDLGLGRVPGGTHSFRI
jgi:hypothetical protein